MDVDVTATADEMGVGVIDDATETEGKKNKVIVILKYLDKKNTYTFHLNFY